jgi:hypothetical protein
MITKNFIILIILLLSIIIIISCTIKFKVDEFTDMSCYAQQNKHYQPEELMFKSRCRNLVILKKYKNGYPLFFAEDGDQNGPYFSKDYSTYYYLGRSPNGEYLDLEYDLYYYPIYNPIRWLYGPYGYHRPYLWHRRNRFDKLDKLHKLDKLDKLDKLHKLDKLDKLHKLDKLDKLKKSNNTINIRNKPVGKNINLSKKNNVVANKSLAQQKYKTISGASSRL